MNVALAAIPFFVILFHPLFFLPKVITSLVLFFSTESEAMNLCPVEAAY